MTRMAAFSGTGVMSRNLAARAEIGLLIALCVFLPLFEAPKTLAWLGYVLLWIVNRARAGDWGGRWGLWDWLFSAWLASGFVVAAFAGLHGSEWRGAVDLLRYATLAWLLHRSRYTDAEMRWVLDALIVSVLLGLAQGHWALWTGRHQYLELNSVGHVNHTAIYIAIILMACAARLFAGGGALIGAVLTVLIVSLVISASRGGIVVALAALLVLGVAWWRRSRKPVIGAVALVALTIAVAWLGRVEVVRKHQADVEAQNLLAFRDGIWRAALVAWERYPLFGVGMDNYGLVKLPQLKAWRSEAGKNFDAARYAEFPHGHSLYLNALAERGMLGSVPLVAVLAAWLVFLLRYRPPGAASPDDWLWWGASAGAWMITTGVGLVNTTLHHEHGILAALLLGLWLSRLRRAGR
jgi:O-antigen ligase